MNLLIRKAIYAVLFSKPLFNYSNESNDGNKTFDVLIAGEDDNCIEAFKAVYWCGQSAKNRMLNITIISACPEKTEQKLCRIMPALNNDIVNVNIAYKENESDLSVYRYYFLSNSYLSLLGKIPSFEKRIVCGFSEADVAIASNNIEFFDLSDRDLFANEKEVLDRYAFNCDYAYRMGEDERCVKGSIDDFVKKEDKDSESDYYNYLSSLSFPVHIPYKINICMNGVEASTEQQIQFLMSTIKEKNELYYTLLEVEHRRWVAYMITEGWSMPSDKDINTYAFLNYGYGGNDQRNKKEKLHPCICKSSDRKCLIESHPELWRIIEESQARTIKDIFDLLLEKYPTDEFCELEAVSYLLYGIVCDRAKTARNRIDQLFDFVDSIDDQATKKTYENLRRSVLKLSNDENNSAKLFVDAVSEAISITKDQTILDKLNDIQCAMKIFIEKNKKKDYFMIDAVMIDMIPFCLWYGVENKSIITISAGLAVEDIVVPTILCAETAIFVEKKQDVKYENAIKSFFENSRRGNTTVVFTYCNSDNQDEVINCIEKLKDKYEKIAINCVTNNNAATVMAIGAFADSCHIPVFTYSYKSGIENIKNGNLINQGLNRKSLSMDEIAGLLGGDYSNIYTKVPFLYELDELEEVFVKYSREKTYVVNGKKRTSSPWSSLSNLFQSSSKNQCPNITVSFRKATFNGCFDKQIYKECGIQNFLPLLEKYHIIRNFKSEYEKDYTKPFVNVSFVYYDSGLEKLLRRYTIDNKPTKYKESCLKTRLVFSTSAGIQLLNLISKNAQLCNSDENNDIRLDKIKFINELRARGFLQEVEFDQKKDFVSIEFKDFVVKNVFKNQGKLFELLLYYKVKNSGMFDDVQTGVKIVWDQVKETRDEMIIKQLEKTSHFGYDRFLTAKRQVDLKHTNLDLTTTTDNEVDIVVTSGMSPIFISCKTAKSGGNEWLYEIASVSNHFCAHPVLALSKDLDKESSAVFLSRARRMNVSVIGAETIFNEDRLRVALERIKRGDVVIGSETAT